MCSKDYPKAVLVGAVLLACLTVLLIGCSEKGGGTRTVNVPPETYISFGPKEDGETYFKVEAYWYGSDEDGDIDRFAVATVRGLDSEAYANLDPDGLQTILDSLEAAGAWQETASRESTFVLESDSCCVGGGEVKYAQGFWGLLVRAIDNEGAVDPDPASLFFVATNVMPKVNITVPEKLPGFKPDVPPHPFIEWEGDDPDGDDVEIQYKYIMLAQQGDTPDYSQLPPLDSAYTAIGHEAPPFGKWSQWVPSDCTFVKDLDFAAYRSSPTDVVFVVTAKDEGGAVLPKSLFGPAYNKGKNWVMLNIITTGDGVRIVVDAGALGRRFSGQEDEYKYNIAGMFKGTEISFRFWGEEEKARGEIAEAYRYYWDTEDDPTSAWPYWLGTEPLREPGSVPEWFIRYPVDGSKFAPTTGPHVFVVELRDVNRVETHCEFRIDVLDGPSRLTEDKILLVDDDHAKYLEPPWLDFDEHQDELWAEILDGYNWEEWDTGRSHQDRLPISYVGEATTVIWLADDEIIETPASHLIEVTTRLGNYLYSYVRVGGNLIIVGRNPIYAHAYWPDGTPNPDNRPSFTDFDFRPQYKRAEDDTMYNFNWEIFGIEKMSLPNPGVPFNAVWTCDICDPAFPDTIDALPEAGKWWKGEFGNAFYITQLRQDIGVHPIYSTAYREDGEYTGSGSSRLIAVYVPGYEDRGYAAYIGFPAEWFDREDIKALIQQLLEIFGEDPKGS
jgi:hypothetical protein